MSSHDQLREIALAEFATVGYAGTSLQQIAEIAGLSKSSVLYHYSSKEALLEAAIAPAIDRMEAILAAVENERLSDAGRALFLEQFVDLLLEYKLAVHMFINQGPSLVDVPVIDRANAFIVRLATFFDANSESLVDKMRFGIALGGAAYMLCTVHTLDIEIASPEETRAALLTIMSELLAPIPSRSTTLG